MRGDGFVARKDNRGRNMRAGESQRKDGLYMYRYKDERTDRRLAVYSSDLAELRKKRKKRLRRCIWFRSYDGIFGLQIRDF